MLTVTVPAQCAYYCYYYYSSYYSSRRQLCYYYYYYYYYDDSDSSSSSAGAIAGGVIGGIVGLAVIVTIFVCACVKICKTQNLGQIMVYPQQTTANTNSITQPGYPQPSVPVYSYGPPTYLGKNQQAVGRNNISIIDC
eukprot:XP_019922598.1 PREDICTED: uncharacterized protein LOC105327787 [Crassostrea gigas]